MKADDDLRLGHGSVLGLEADFQSSNQWIDGRFGFASFTAARTIVPVATRTFPDRLVWFGTVHGSVGRAFDPVPRTKFQYLCTLMAQAAAEVRAEI